MPHAIERSAAPTRKVRDEARAGYRRPMVPRATLRRLATALALALVLGAGSRARADEPSPEELAAARALFNEGKDDEKRNAWADALEKFKKVAAVKMTPQVRFHLALCDENLGHLVSAINGFELAAEEAKRAGKSAADVAENAPPRAEALRKRVPALKLHPTGRLATSKILLDGSAVQAALLDTEIPVDPGKHVIEVDSAGKPGFRRELSLTERETQTIEVEVDDEDKPIPTPAPPPKPPPPPAPPPSRLPVWLAGGVGVAGLVGSGVFFGLRQSAIAEVRSHCKNGDSACDPADYATSVNGQRYGTASGVLLGVGIAGVATAGVLFFVLGPKKPAAQPSRAALLLGPTPGGATLAGTF
jgi:hypothetical protein